MNLTVEKVSSHLIIKLDGQFDLHTAKDFKTKVTRYLNKEDKNLILDLETIDFIDSSGIGAILSIYKKVEKNGVELVIINISSPLKRVFELSGLLNIIRLYSSRNEALKKLQRR